MAKNKTSNGQGMAGKVKEVATDAAITMVTGAVIGGAAVIEGVQRVVTGQDPNQPQPPTQQS